MKGKCQCCGELDRDLVDETEMYVECVESYKRSRELGYNGPVYSTKTFTCGKCGRKLVVPFHGRHDDLFPLEYLKTVPTEPGCYWVKTQTKETVEELKIYGEIEGLVVIRNNSVIKISDLTKWSDPPEYAGPIPKPYTKDR